jgi:hypothetical protein
LGGTAAGGYLWEEQRKKRRKAGKATAGYFPQPIEDPSFLRRTAMATAAAGYLRNAELGNSE